MILFHILAKNKESILEYWLKQNLTRMNYPKQKVILYFRTNNNTDKTKSILQTWIAKQTEWHKIIFEGDDVPEKVEQFGVHEWNTLRVKVLATLRQEGIQKAIDLKVDYYFVCDVDNFLIPDTLGSLVKLNVPLVAPLLRYAVCEEDNRECYSNFHHPVDEKGYFVQSVQYKDIVLQKYTGLHQVELVHCTYLIRKDMFDKIHYQDGSLDYEYVIFGRAMRYYHIPQLLDNRQIYGCLTLTENKKACKDFMKHLMA
jgi:hypothetical protein